MRTIRKKHKHISYFLLKVAVVAVINLLFFDTTTPFSLPPAPPHFLDTPPALTGTQGWQKV